MAKKSVHSLLVLACLLPLLSAPTLMIPNSSHAAAQRPNPKPQKCFALARQIGASRVWWGRHVGSRERNNLFEIGPSRDNFNAIGCFKTRKDCENWLYWKRTEYPDFRSARPCRRGL